ncbi:GNAT family N-acetyltransferase [Paludicola sp. MB14-C6]|uniref:GNAT family N-acetyltransferase n=1 Tax=Paludihabitans sp. MB14-C6 TaxID=3070656 RepID=UPI0027DAC68B|nr:GNAT family N-acetyltransferase [Paludicola sp. MB14-C6]WMJ22487.1 GNAT family N-acetyltransferase [Paludicola sp. MB14-C6]
MNKIKIHENYFENEQLRNSFNQLAMKTFGLDFEPWYQENAFCQKYIPFACVLDEQVVANVSVNKFQLVMNGAIKNALQFGTVMTDIEHRNQGLCKQLMKHILKKYDKEYDFMFLYANNTVLNLYPKFKFQRIQEFHYQINATAIKRVPSMIHFLDATNPIDRDLIINTCKNRKPVSTKLGVLNDDWPLIYYAFSEDWEQYYLPDDHILVLISRQEGVLHIYDIISPNEFRLDDVLKKIVNQTDEMVQLHFVPDQSNYEIIKTPFIDDDDALFIRSKHPLSSDFLFPKTSIT